MDKENILQNLKDAGCNPLTIDKILNLLPDIYNQEVFRLLSDHRCKLLDELHKNQKQIDCLDFLIFHLKQNN